MSCYIFDKEKAILIGKKTNQNAIKQYKDNN
jgi:hypothetical protein